MSSSNKCLEENKKEEEIEWWPSYLDKVALGKRSWQDDQFKPPSVKIGCVYLGSPWQTVPSWLRDLVLSD